MKETEMRAYWSKRLAHLCEGMREKRKRDRPTIDELAKCHRSLVRATAREAANYTFMRSYAAKFRPRIIE